MEDVLLVEKQGHICTLSLNRPQRRHALNTELLRRLGDTVKALNSDTEIRVVILRGTGEKYFSSGMDITDEVSKDSYNEAHPYALKSIMACRCPVIAMIYGYALGASCDLAVSCDFRIAADTARLGINPVKIGWVYPYEGIQRLVNLVGISNAKEMFFTGRFFEATKAREMGLVNYVVPEQDVFSTTMSLANEIAENAPLAVGGIKAIMTNLPNYQNPSAETKAKLLEIIDAVRQSEDAREGPRAFLEKRQPHFTGK